MSGEVTQMAQWQQEDQLKDYCRGPCSTCWGPYKSTLTADRERGIELSFIIEPAVIQLHDYCF